MFTEIYQRELARWINEQEVKEMEAKELDLLRNFTKKGAPTVATAGDSTDLQAGLRIRSNFYVNRIRIHPIGILKLDPAPIPGSYVPINKAVNCFTITVKFL